MRARGQRFWWQLLQKAKASYELPAVIQKFGSLRLAMVIDEHQLPCAATSWKPRCLVLSDLPPLERPLVAVTFQPPFREWDTIFPSGSMTVASGWTRFGGTTATNRWASKARATAEKAAARVSK